ncbi:MAG: carbon-nitrogen hydrolase family protein [Lactococcus chungangensis]|uniref:Nitrilase n=1 Tax=Pseudolactococcus chungangensis CAU 28 = DSM 22330 TaxID=1122154 RepID=A0A1K2HFX1_9LACT|nr:carbon-nitrogen hydrolase family protein [Lactococcus chungangensis]MDD3015711.1 carbon-nitrogen hydrolase family protein [Lactococcus chungangensis]PCS03248.1 nitrilase [Lactococcus chungangensis CAU 28 = DSM 22330]SFZ75619.1 Predicted amidohydrolase [Lactococcus chungangensis CAU 28 = DSM 22330]
MVPCRQYKIAIVQLQTSCQLKDNLVKIEKFIRVAAQEGAKLIAFPEVMNIIDSHTPSYSESDGGETFRLLSRLAKTLGVYIHGGSWSETIPASKKHYNTSYLFDDKGIVVGKYRKIHTFDITDPSGQIYRESDTVTSGQEVVVVETPLGKLGFAICYDLRFPELHRLLALKGAEIIFNPSDFNLMTGKDHWEVLLRARAIENGVYMIAADQYGQNAKMLAYGNSLVVNPWGTVIARAGDGEQILYADIDLDGLAEIRNRMQTLENRQSEVYRLSENAQNVARNTDGK